MGQNAEIESGHLALFQVNEGSIAVDISEALGLAAMRKGLCCNWDFLITLCTASVCLWHIIIFFLRGMDLLYI